MVEPRQNHPHGAAGDRLFEYQLSRMSRSEAIMCVNLSIQKETQRHQEAIEKILRAAMNAAADAENPCLETSPASTVSQSVRLP